jgi:hypothetical protein
MINVYKVKYHPATDNSGARFTVTRIDDQATRRAKYNYGVANAEQIAIHDAFGEDADGLEYVGKLSKCVHLFAIQH